jgi:hypothetical protein
LVGFAGAASADATIELIWADTGTNSYVDPVTSANIVLNVVLNTGSAPAPSRGGSLTVDYSAALGELTFVSASNDPGPPARIHPFGLPTHDLLNSQVLTLNSVLTDLLPLTSIVLATITFNVTAGSPGTFDIITLLTAPFDNIQHLSAGGLGTASITKTPEPGTLSLLVMGLTGLYVVGRRRGR